MVTDFGAKLQPGRLYLVVTEREIAIPTPETWAGRFEALPAVPFSSGAVAYRMELANEWPVQDAYVWFLSALGYNGTQKIEYPPPVVIFDAEAERAQIEGASSIKNLTDDVVKGGSRIFDGMGNAMDGFSGLVSGAGFLLSLLPWIAGLALIIAAVYYGSKAAK